MQIKPVTKADKPEYPTASDIDIPKVLNASKPKKWKRNAAIGAVMVGMIIIPAVTKTKENSKQATNMVAPLFEHGKGVGTLGCMVINPPMFISEKEAFDIIRSELLNSDNNWRFGTDTSKYIDITNKYIKKNDLFVDTTFGLTDKYTEYKQTRLYSKFIDSTSGIGFVYISETNYLTYKDEGLYDWIASVYDVETKSVATKIINQAKSQHKSIVVFYDPIIIPSKINHRQYDHDLIETDIKNTFLKSKDSLRAQVRDFLAWYKKNKGKK